MTSFAPTSELGRPDGVAAGPGSLHGSVAEGLRRLYADYRRREAAQLLALVPREALRPLYRAAREATPGGAEDPLGLLSRWVETVLLPLPPFHVWLKDFQDHREAHLEGLDRDPAAPDPRRPVAVEVRRVRFRERDWDAALHLFRRGTVWWGFIEYTGDGGEPVARTADIFREEQPGAIRERFRSFGPEALEAFLRSSLP